MARGWGSKSVESQIESAEAAKRPHKKNGPEPVEVERLRKKESLQLSRIRVLHDLESAQHPRYKKILSDALAYLDDEIAKLG